MADEPWTIRRLLDWTEKYFREKGGETPRVEAQVLLAHALGCKRIDLYTRTEEEPTAEQRAAFRALIKQRVEGRPVAYLVGQREFYSLAFEVNPAVLIPRPETEFLVVECLNAIQGREAPRVLDIGTGSGNIAVSVAHRYKSAQVTAVDVSPEALDVARRNAERHGVADRVRFLEGNLFEPVPAGERFDAIASNPPYVTEAEWADLATDVKDHEPRLALAAGPEGLDVYRRLIPAAAQHLEPGGTLLLEIGSGQEAAVRALLEAETGFQSVKTVLDGARLPRVLRAIWKPTGQ